MSDDQLEEVSDKKSRRTNPNYQAQAILSRRDHSEFEVKQKMARKGFDQNQIDAAIDFLKRHKLLDDERFAAMFVSNTLRFKQVGPQWLILKLQQKGVAHEIIEPAVFGELDTEREEELAGDAAKAWLKRTRKHEGLRMKLQRFLIQRGFSFDVVERVVESLL